MKNRYHKRRGFAGVCCLISLLIFSVGSPGAGAQEPYVALTLTARSFLARGKMTKISLTVGPQSGFISGLSFQLFAPPRIGPIQPVYVAFLGDENLSFEKGTLLGNTNPDPILKGVRHLRDDWQSLQGSYQADFPATVGPSELIWIAVYVPYDLPDPQFRLIAKNSDGPVIQNAVTKISGEPYVGIFTRTPPMPTDIRLFGDMNADGAVTVADVIRVLRAAIGLENLSDAEKWYADVYPIYPKEKQVSEDSNDRLMGDDEITIPDVALLLQVALGLWQGWWPDSPPQ